MPEKIKKKRGRKPKETTIVNNNPVFADDKDSIDDLIIKLNYNDVSNDNIDNTSNNDILYNINDITKNTSELCWNCCHSFSNQATGIPLSYVDGVFHIYGYFCSFNCGARYIFDNYTDKNKWNLYSLLNLYYNISQDTRGKTVSPAPNKLVLAKFGGNISIDDYRKKNISYEISIPPIIPHNHSIKQINEFKSSEKNKEQFKLYRKTPLNTKNNIYNTMNLS